MAGVLTLNGTKRSSDRAACADPNGRCMRWCGRGLPALRRATRHRPLCRHLDWRYRPQGAYELFSFRAEERTIKAVLYGVHRAGGSPP
jgi:hypothetical protein